LKELNDSPNDTDSGSSVRVLLRRVMYVCCTSSQETD
jgi:hypothetical protein